MNLTELAWDDGNGCVFKQASYKTVYLWNNFSIDNETRHDALVFRVDTHVIVRFESRFLFRKRNRDRRQNFGRSRDSCRRRSCCGGGGCDRSPIGRMSELAFFALASAAKEKLANSFGHRQSLSTVDLTDFLSWKINRKQIDKYLQFNVLSKWNMNN